ncbi:precorrin-6A/cobalt-precorrin-6A reductase [Geodermatophilus dictyosporus]|uniref:Precorrin-6A/cobalt-precorrin-6A reductase n=1 Tax=Geodermatophilus dictyosporus TaxID=1523247 RepID=A0A1I5N660_9ACTN|nr:cobalt-precorrin-6A reductase [Geodermatophilus dictyosporus]SFP17308.1 precorrin-6A/cobalt-precorrin-6A reductase [Geodermatophilus dictyosporus]
MSGQVLVLGGTGEARRLAAALVAGGADVLSSLAGRVADPALPEGGVRVGGFGGADGLAGWLAEHRPRAVVDATHPFAARITASAAVAAARTGVPLLRLQRPGWTRGPGDRWTYVDSLDEAAGAVRDAGSVLLTTGRQGVGAFAGLTGRVLVRSVDPPDEPLPARAVLLLARGPFAVDDEVALMREHGVEVVVTKDSGGAMTEAKLAAARALGLPVVLVRRPPLPAGVEVVATVAEAVAWTKRLRWTGAGTEDGPSWTR